MSNDEERSQMRYVVRIAEFSESSNLCTQMALPASGLKHTSSSGATTPLGRASRASGPWPLLLFLCRSEGAGSSGDRRLGPRVGGRSTSTVCRANVLTTLFCGHWFRARDPHWRGRGLYEAATIEREELFRAPLLYSTAME